MTRPITSAVLAVLLAVTAAACRNSAAEPDTNAPTVHITGPSAITRIFVGEAFTLQGQSADDTGVTRVAVSAGDAGPIDATLQADGSWSAQITPTVAGTLSITATVTVNGESIPLEGTSYQGPLSAPLPAGAPVTLSVSEGGLTVNVEWSLPAVPIQAGPADGSTFSAGDEVVLTWESSDDPDHFQIVLIPDGLSNIWSGPITGNERSFDVDLSALPAGTSLIAWEVVASNAASPAEFTGPAAGGSRVVGEARTGLWKFTIGSP